MGKSESLLSIKAQVQTLDTERKQERLKHQQKQATLLQCRVTVKRAGNNCLLLASMQRQVRGLNKPVRHVAACGKGPGTAQVYGTHNLRFNLTPTA